MHLDLFSLDEAGLGPGNAEILQNVLSAYDQEQYQLIKERDFVLLNELKWFLIYKFSTSLDWEGSADEAQTLEVLEIFAALLHFFFNENNPELVLLEYEYLPDRKRLEKWDYVTFWIRQVFGSDRVTEMDDLLKAVWADMVKATNIGKGKK